MPQDRACSEGNRHPGSSLDGARHAREVRGRIETERVHRWPTRSAIAELVKTARYVEEIELDHAKDTPVLLLMPEGAERQALANL